MTFMKWAGGKTQLLAEIVPRLPDRIGTYYEPFVGGGAVFFALAAGRRFERAVIGDANRYLVDTYRVVQRSVGLLIKVLRAHAKHARNPSYFYKQRALDPDDLDPIERAAWLIFLNRTCFNGLYRVNSLGHFNVPFGRYKSPRVLDEDRLRACSSALRRVKIVHADFAELVEDAGEGDAAYFDPPYLPVSDTSFVAYGAARFGAFDHSRLAGVYRGLVSRGVRAVLSSSDCRAARRIYRGLELVEVQARRAINSTGTKRGRVGELLVVGS